MGVVCEQGAVGDARESGTEAIAARERDQGRVARRTTTSSAPSGRARRRCPATRQRTTTPTMNERSGVDDERTQRPSDGIVVAPGTGNRRRDSHYALALRARRRARSVYGIHNSQNRIRLRTGTRSGNADSMVSARTKRNATI